MDEMIIGNPTIDYYKVGGRSNIVISNSFLNTLDPAKGGSPQKALAFLDNNLEQEEIKYLENGKLLHKYCENPNTFALAEIDRPSDMMGDFLDEFHRLKSSNTSIDITQDIEITSKNKSESGKTSEILATKSSFENLGKLLGLDYKTTVILFRQARLGAYKSYGEGVLVDKIISSGIDYLKQAEKLNGKISLTKADKLILESAKSSIYSNPLINKYFNLSGMFEKNIIWKELDIYFNLIWNQKTIKCKARLDNVYIDVENKIIYLNDLKTTSKPLSLFQDTLEYYKYYRQLAWYEKALKEYLRDNHPEYSSFTIIPQICAVETIGDFNSCIFNVSPYTHKGIQELQSLIARFNFHQDNNIWNQQMEQAQGHGVIKLIPK